MGREEGGNRMYRGVSRVEVCTNIYESMYLQCSTYMYHIHVRTLPCVLHCSKHCILIFAGNLCTCTY